MSGYTTPRRRCRTAGSRRGGSPASTAALRDRRLPSVVALGNDPFWFVRFDATALKRRRDGLASVAAPVERHSQPIRDRGWSFGRRCRSRRTHRRRPDRRPTCGGNRRRRRPSGRGRTTSTPSARRRAAAAPPTASTCRAASRAFHDETSSLNGKARGRRRVMSRCRRSSYREPSTVAPSTGTEEYGSRYGEARKRSGAECQRACPSWKTSPLIVPELKVDAVEVQWIGLGGGDADPAKLNRSPAAAVDCGRARGEPCGAIVTYPFVS